MTLASISSARSSAPRWMVVALFASLALNLVIAGATAGFVWRHAGRVAEAQAAHLPPNVLSYTSLLSPARQKELSTLTEQQRLNVRPLRRHLREVREEVARELAAEPFDKDRFLSAQSRLLVADQKAREAVHVLYGEIAAHITPAERRGFADWRQKRRPIRNLLDESADKQANGRPR